MIYEVISELKFYMNGDTREMLTLKPGTKITALPFGSMDRQEAYECKRMSARHRERKPNERVIFFRMEGVVRAAVIGKSLRASTRQRRTNRSTA